MELDARVISASLWFDGRCRSTLGPQGPLPAGIDALVHALECRVTSLDHISHVSLSASGQLECHWTHPESTDDLEALEASIESEIRVLRRLVELVLTPPPPRPAALQPIVRFRMGDLNSISAGLVGVDRTAA
jgi:hypothetical protein